MICKALEYSVAYHALLLFTSVFVTIAVFSHTKRITIFSFHPLCMTIGAIFCVGEGVGVYRNRFIVESLSPIMQKTKRTKVRTIHYAILFAGGCFIMFGFAFILISKHHLQHTIVPSSCHSFLGLGLVGMVIVQGFAGQQKIEDIELKQSVPGKSKYPWHADFGLFLWDVIISTVSAGVYELLAFSNTYILLQCMLICTWATVHLQMRRKGPEGSQLTAFRLMADSNTSGGPLSPEYMDDFASQQVPFNAEAGSNSTFGNDVVSGGEIENPHMV